LKIERNALVVDYNGGPPVEGNEQVRGHRDRPRAVLHGYRTVPIEGVPFDHATSAVNNIAGQVVHPNTGEVVAGEYVVGWAKRGPTGRIGNNKPDSASTVEAMVTDIPTQRGIHDDHRDPSQIEVLLRQRDLDYATYEIGASWISTRSPVARARGVRVHAGALQEAAG
jgi:ferredoxin--NADP+ reductase